MATTFSIFYSGYSPYGNSFTYDNDMNGDGLSGDLIYIPENRGDIQFVSQEDEDAFFAFMEQDNYLSKNKGSYAEAYAARAPWVNKFDLRVMQDFSIQAGGRKHTLQASVDVLNFGNMLNSEWGVNQNMAVSNYGGILHYEGRDVNNVPEFSMVKVSNSEGDSVYPTTTYSNYTNLSQVWQVQVGLRYIF